MPPQTIRTLPRRELDPASSDDKNPDAIEGTHDEDKKEQADAPNGCSPAECFNPLPSGRPPSSKDPRPKETTQCHQTEHARQQTTRGEEVEQGE